MKSRYNLSAMGLAFILFRFGVNCFLSVSHYTNKVEPLMRYRKIKHITHYVNITSSILRHHLHLFRMAVCKRPRLNIT